jgi:hypothetical protein
MEGRQSEVTEAIQLLKEVQAGIQKAPYGMYCISLSEVSNNAWQKIEQVISILEGWEN